MDQTQFDRMADGEGFVAALDQSGGSSPRALASYGVQGPFDSDAAMFEEIHSFRDRIVTSPAFDNRVLATILFQQTLGREFGDLPACEYLWRGKEIVPFVKIDRGLAAEADGVRLMNPIRDLPNQLRSAKRHGAFGTKARSLILQADEDGIRRLAEQQFEVGTEVAKNGLVPILEPEVAIDSTEKREAEELLLAELRRLLIEAVNEPVILKLTLPDQANLYSSLLEHPKVLRIVALSGGYRRDQANLRLAENHGVIASYSRALVEGLTIDLSDQEFDRRLDDTIARTYAASLT